MNRIRIEASRQSLGARASIYPYLILEKEKKKSTLNRKGLFPMQQRNEQEQGKVNPKHQVLVRNGEQDWLVEVEAENKAGKAA